MRVIFVGLHNKTDMKPLDSKSKSGQLIDRIAKPLRHRAIEILKTNLFNVEYVPHNTEREKLAFDWVERVELFKEDTIVLLGAMVHANFPELPLARVIKIAHPASKRSHKEMNEYVEKTLALILQ